MRFVSIRALPIVGVLPRSDMILSQDTDTFASRYKVKCVGTPICARCEKHGVFCQFDFSARPSLRSPASSQHSATDGIQDPTNDISTLVLDLQSTEQVSEVPEIPTSSKTTWVDDGRFQATQIQRELSQQPTNWQIQSGDTQSAFERTDFLVSATL